jgi:predicted RNA-binding protein with PIN domain
MELLIDTWNVLHQTGILPPESAGNGIQGLIRLIGDSRWSKDRITLVCDGTPSDFCPTGARVSVVFTGPHRTADDEIMHRVAKSSAKRSITVVTSDREIIRSIKAAGSQHLGSEAFLQILVDDHNTPQSKKIHRPTGLSKEGAAEWKKRFGLDDDAVEELLKPDEQESASTKSHHKNQPKKLSPRKQDESALPPALLEEARRLLDN